MVRVVSTFFIYINLHYMLHNRFSLRRELNVRYVHSLFLILVLNN